MPPDVMDREDAIEVLRAFVVDGGLSIAFQRAFEEPDMWGLLLVDIARHAARAYSRESEYTEEEALRRILDMFEAEIDAADRRRQHHTAIARAALTVAIEAHHYEFMAGGDPRSGEHRSRKAACRSAPC